MTPQAESSQSIFASTVLGAWVFVKNFSESRRQENVDTRCSSSASDKGLTRAERADKNLERIRTRLDAIEKELNSVYEHAQQFGVNVDGLAILATAKTPHHLLDAVRLRRAMFNRIRIKANRQTLANNIQDKLFEDISQLATLCVNLETDVLESTNTIQCHLRGESEPKSDDEDHEDGGDVRDSGLSRQDTIRVTSTEDASSSRRPVRVVRRNSSEPVTPEDGSLQSQQAAGFSMAVTTSPPSSEPSTPTAAASGFLSQLDEDPPRLPIYQLLHAPLFASGRITGARQIPATMVGLCEYAELIKNMRVSPDHVGLNAARYDTITSGP